MALQVLGEASWLVNFSPDQLESLALLLMEAHRIGYLIEGEGWNNRGGLS